MQYTKSTNNEMTKKIKNCYGGEISPNLVTLKGTKSGKEAKSN